MPDTATVANTSTRTGPAVPWALVSVVAMAMALAALVATGRAPADPATEIGSLIRCPVCQGESIADSPSPMARDMMVVLVESLEDGATRQEAIDSVIGAYPGSLLLEPQVSPATLALWLLPGGALLAGIGLAATVRRSRSGVDEGAERHELDQRLAQIRTDLDDLARQEASGDMDPGASGHLRTAYRTELAETERAAAAPGSSDEPLGRSRTRTVTGAAIVVAALALIVGVAGLFISERPDATSGVAAAIEGDPAEYSDETLAAVIAENQDHPLIDGMRMALAERLFEAGDYQQAFPQYLAVAQSDRASDDQAATALTRLGWMAYDGNGEVETALDLMGQARELAPDDPFPAYLAGLITWCGLGDAEAAAAAFDDVLARAAVETDIRSQIEADRDAARSGEPCPP